MTQADKVKGLLQNRFTIDEVIYCDQFQNKMIHLHEEDKQLNRLKNLLHIEKDQMNTNKENK